jgi:hypothetical protein
MAHVKMAAHEDTQWIFCQAGQDRLNAAFKGSGRLEHPSVRYAASQHAPSGYRLIKCAIRVQIDMLHR